MWQEIVLLKQLMMGSDMYGMGKPDFLMLIDADTYITNTSILVENFFNPCVVNLPVDFVITSDYRKSPDVQTIQASAKEYSRYI